jgi:tetratricopeptide (TPR) repeat protein
MNGKLMTPWLGLLVLFITSAVPGQTSAPSSGQPPAQGLRTLTGADAQRAQHLEEAIDRAMKEDRWEEAISQAEELLALRARLQGEKHFETVDAMWRVKTLRRVAARTKGDRAAFLAARDSNEQAESLQDQGQYAAAQPLFEKALAVRRRLFSDDHPLTAESSNNLATNLNDQGKYAQAQALHQKALEIFHRLFADDHPNTAISSNNLAYNLQAQGKYSQAQPLYEKALAIRRRLLGDDHLHTATGSNNLAANLMYQGQYAAAQPLFEKALAIRRRLLSDDHPLTAESYNNLAYNLRSQGKYAVAQPLYEKALEIDRRLLGDDHLRTATGYNNLAGNLKAQGEYAAAQPLLEKALAIRRRRLTDDHPLTAQSYNNLAYNLTAQGRYSAAQPLFEKALEIWRRLVTDDHPDIAASSNNLAYSLNAQGQYAAAQPLFEKALAIRRRLLSDDHLDTAASSSNLASNLDAQGKYREARDRWLSAVKSLDASRLRVAFTGLERAGTKESARLGLAAVLARLGQPAEAWQALEQDLGRGLLDELAARQDLRLTSAERARLRELTTALERLDRLVETTPQNLDQAERAKRFEGLKRQRELASIALGEFHTKLVQDHGALAGPVATLSEIQAALPAETALVVWVDPTPRGPNAADPGGEHWGVIVRGKGTPAWVRLPGLGKDKQWTEDDTKLPVLVRGALVQRPRANAADVRTLLRRLRAQRLDPLTDALRGTTDGLPAAHGLIVLPSSAMAGVPVEALLQPGDPWIVSYAPSATVWKSLREQPRPDRHAGLLALGDPVFDRPEPSSDPRPLPDHGLLVNMVVPGSNAARHGLKPGDVLLTYDGKPLQQREDLKAMPEPGKPVPVDVWRDGQIDRRELSPGKLGVVLDPRPAAVALTDQRRLDQVLTAARSGSEHFARLPGTRHEVEALAHLFEAARQPTRVLTETAASEPELDRLAGSGELGRYGYIHLATHGLIDEAIPQRSAVILTQTGLPDPLVQVLKHQPVFDGRLTMREIQRGWELNAALVTLSACETARGPYAGGEGFVGFTQALLLSGARSVCLSLWKVDDRATALLMIRFYQNLLGRRPGLAKPLPKAEALQEAKAWLRSLTADEADDAVEALERGPERPLATASIVGTSPRPTPPRARPAGMRPYAHPYYWAAFILVGDPD